MAFRITLEVEGLDRAIERRKRMDEDLKNQISVAVIENVQQAIVVARNLAPTEDEVDRIQNEFWKNYNSFWQKLRRRIFGRSSRPTIWRLAPIIDSIGITELDEMVAVAGVSGAGQVAREIEFGNRYINARPYWRPPIWEAFFRVRREIKQAIGEIING